MEKCVQRTDEEAKNHLSNITTHSMFEVLPVSNSHRKKRILKRKLFFQRWDCIEIQEEAENEIVKSKIKVPLKPSLSLQQLMNKLNDDLSKVLPHTLPRQIHTRYIEKNAHLILNRYKNLMGQQLNQIQALQFLFDVKFLTRFCVLGDNSQLIGLSQEICDSLRAKIDPFDLDVFYPYLQSNVNRAVGQSQVKYLVNQVG